MNFEKINSVFFLGIGGIGMSALARWFKSTGKSVSGYDKTKTPNTDKLISEGIDVYFEDDINLIPDEIKNHKETSLIVFTPAIPKDNIQRIWLQDHGYKLHKRAEILGHISSNFNCIAVAGTHGKTSVTSMIAHMLRNANRNITAFVGGIMKNYDSNVIIGKPERKDHWVLAEADEFDRSFLQLSPNISIITSAEADHLDIYGREEELKDNFRLFAKRLKSKGRLFIQNRFINDFIDIEEVNISNYGIESGNTHAENLKILEGKFYFDAILGDYAIENLELSIPGFHNLENALAAISVCFEIGLSDKEISKGLASYSGVKRRFELIVNKDQIIYIDDYAHHPTEIEALLKSVKSIYPGKKITAIFQPHLYSRTRDFADGFSKSLSLADKVILLPIYPARELPIEGIESEMLLNGINSAEKQCLDKDSALMEVKKINEGVLLSIGAGDIDQLVPKIKEILK